MKQVLFVVALWAPVVGWGQVLNGVDIGKMENVRYMEVVVSKVGGAFSKGYFAKADFGQGLKLGEEGFEENGEAKTFKSDIHVLNWLNGFGWKLIRDWNEGATRHFLVERAPPNGK